jgi:hypothetical protein
VSDAEFFAEVDAELGIEPQGTPPEEPAAPSETPEASAPEGTSEDRPRDEQGRFVKQEEPEQEQPLILGRFKSHEDLEKAYAELDSEFGRRNQEWGELRKEIEQIRTAQQPPQQQAVPINQETVNWFDEQVEQNPYGAVEWARQNDPSGVLWNRAVEAWYEMSPREASAYERRLEYQQLTEHFGQQQRPMQEVIAQNQISNGFMSFLQKEPEANKYAEQMLAEAEANPELLTPLTSGSLEAQERVFRNLYRLARAEQASTAVSQTGEALAQQQAQAEAAKQQAFVATGSQIQEPETKSPQERWLEEFFDPAAKQFYGDT